MKGKIIYVMPRYGYFTKADVQLLEGDYKVVINTYEWFSRKHLTPFYLLHQFFTLLWHMPTAKAVLISFGGYWALLPTLLGKVFNVPVSIILNGTGCASIPPVNYGTLRTPHLKLICKWSYQMASMLLPVSDSLRYARNTYYSDDEVSYQGYQHFFPQIKTKHRVLYNGVDPSFFRPSFQIEREERSFIAVISSGQYVLKGGDMIVALGERMPDCQFYIAGLKGPADANTVIPENVHFLGKLKPEDLKAYYNKCRFHFQLSIFEGFGVALCEAMLCGCIPIGSSVNMIPEIIGETGFVLPKRDIGALEALVREVLLLPVGKKDALSKRARTRIAENYSMEERKKNLIEVISNCEL